MQRAHSRRAPRDREPRSRRQIGAGADRGPALILGAIIAGGAARRFGSDKGAASLGGTALLDHAADLLCPHVEKIAVVGRNWRDLPRIEDRPGVGLGPMGGIAGALSWARDKGFALVLTIGCDTPRVPVTLFETLLARTPAWCGDNPLIGAWPSDLADEALRYVATDPRRSVRGWAETVGAARIDEAGIANLNTPADLAALEQPR